MAPPVGVVNLIDTRDVAAAARAVLLERDSTGLQRAFQLTGLRAWSMPAIAAELSRLPGRTVDYHRRTPEEQRAYLLASGLSEFVADLLLGLDRTVRESSLQETTMSVALLTGHPPRTVPDWLADNLALFQPPALS